MRVCRAADDTGQDDRIPAADGGEAVLGDLPHEIVRHEQRRLFPQDVDDEQKDLIHPVLARDLGRQLDDDLLEGVPTNQQKCEVLRESPYVVTGHLASPPPSQPQQMQRYNYFKTL